MAGVLHRVPSEPLHGQRKIRFFRGILYPYVRKGNTFLKKVTISLSKRSQEEHLHFDDPVIALHDGDFELDIFKGLPVRRTHNTKDGKPHMYGDIGVWDGAKINDKRELEAWGQLYGDIPEGYQAILDYDHKELTGLSIKFVNHISKDNLMLGKTIVEGSLTPTGGAHYDDCFITVSCSKKTTTNNNNYIPNSDDKRNNYENCGNKSMSDTSQMNGQPVEGNGNMSPQSGGYFPNGDVNQKEDNNPLSDNNSLGKLINDLRGQLKTENEAKKAANAKLAEQEKALLLAQKKTKFYEDKDKKMVEEKNKEILKELPDVLSVLSSCAGIKDVSELNPDTVKLIQTAWTDPAHRQLMDMTKAAAKAMTEHRKEQRMWAAQKKQFGSHMNSTAVEVGAAKAHIMLDNVQEDNRRERLRQQKSGLPSYDEVYVPDSQGIETGNSLGPQYEKLFSGSNYGYWENSREVSRIPQTYDPGVPIIPQSGLTKSRTFDGMSRNDGVRDVAVGAAAPRFRQQNRSPGQVPQYPSQPEQSSVNPYGMAQQELNQAFSMNMKTAQMLCPVMVTKGAKVTSDVIH